jgi:glycerol-3-phosphate acyltransferase PlsY
MAWQLLLMLALGYLVGSIPCGVIVGRIRSGVDIREYGSGKMGFTNSLRTLGWGPSIAVLVGDLCKGIIPALIGRLVFDSALLATVGAGAAVVGHVFPLFAGFRGGRGVATAFGGIIIMIPVTAIIFPLVGALIVLVTRYMSVMSILGAIIGLICVSVIVAIGHANAVYLGYALAGTALILYMHRANIERLRRGTEPKIGEPAKTPARTAPVR